MSDDKKNFKRDISAYVSSNIYQKFCGILNTFIKPRLLSPEFYGLWNIFNMVMTIATYMHFGSRNAMFYQVPYHKGNNEPEKAKVIESSVFYGTFYINIPVILIILIYFFISDMNKVEVFGLITTVVIVILNWYYDYYYTYLNANHHFMVTSRLNYLRATFSVVLNLVLIYSFHIYGMYIASALIVVFSIYLIRKSVPLKFEVKPDKKVFNNMVKMGFPIMIYNLINELVSMTDRMIVGYFLGTKQLGYYAITGLVFSFLMQVPNDSRDVIEPHMMKEYSSGSREDNMKEYFFKPQVYMAFLMPFMLGIAYFGTPAFIKLILPAYLPSIFPTKIIILGSFFFALTYVARSIIIAGNYQNQATVLIFASAVINSILGIAAVKLGYGINGVAVGSFITFVVLFIMVNLFVMIRFEYKITVWFQNNIDILPPLVVMMLLIVILEKIFVYVNIHYIFVSIFQAVLFTLLFYMFFSYYSHRSVYLSKIDLAGKIIDKLGKFLPKR